MAYNLEQIQRETGDFFVPIWEAYRDNEQYPTVAEFCAEYERLTHDGEHPFDCKCMLHV